MLISVEIVFCKINGTEMSINVIYMHLISCLTYLLAWTVHLYVHDRSIIILYCELITERSAVNRKIKEMLN